MGTLKITRTCTTHFRGRGHQWTNILLIFGFLLVLYTTLFPFDFFFKENFSLKEIARRFYLRPVGPGALTDWPRNVLLFLPFSFGFTSLMQKRKLSGAATLITTLAAGAGLSFMVELLQVFLPMRAPSLADILANSAGTFLGYLSFCLWGDKILGYTSALVEKSKAYLSVKKLAISFIGYAVLILLVLVLWQNRANLSNWNQTFPLILGNEQTGDRPWQGYISELHIADRAITKEEITRAFSDRKTMASIEAPVLVSYQLTGEENHHNHMEEHLWLDTAIPVAFLTQRILETSQFTVSAVVATANLEQTGPARIISISENPARRNFTVGQSRTDLIIRLRTPATGENGTKPELVVPDVFVDTKPHHLIITYDGSILRLYIDGLQRSYAFELVLAPGVMLVQHLFPAEVKSIHLNPTNMVIYKVLYYGFIFIPLGSILALIVTIPRRRSAFHILLVWGGLLLPSLLLETVLVSGGGGAIRLENILLGIVITMSAMLLMKTWAVSWGQKNKV